MTSTPMAPAGANSKLHSARKAKNDEFYTQLGDIENELRHYKGHFRGKTVLLNCDDPTWSNFWTYFVLNFEHLGLKKLIATHYTGPDGPPSYKLEVEAGRDVNGNGKVGMGDEVRTELLGDGDFRSDECVALLEESDIVVTNPPFSCYSRDTEVKTQRGWKLFEDVLDDDLICSLNLETNAVEYVPFVDRIVSRVDGHLLHFGNRRFDLLVTKNHRMIARASGKPVRVDGNGQESLIRADEVKAHHTVPVKGFDWVGERRQWFELPGVQQTEQYTRRIVDVPVHRIDMGAWLEFFGMWLADGCTRQGVNTQGNPRFTVSIKQSQDNEDYIVELFRSIGFECKREGAASGNHNYTVYSKQLWTYLAQFGKSRDKFIPEWMLSLDKPLLTRLWDGYVAGDSHGDDGLFNIGSVSRDLMDGLQTLALRVLGYIIQIRKVKMQYGGEPYDYYAASFSKRDVTTNFKYGEATEVEYHDDVYCLELEKNGTMLVRRNDKIAWSGNCFREYVAQLMEHGKQFLIIGNMNANRTSMCLGILPGWCDPAIAMPELVA